MKAIRLTLATFAAAVALALLFASHTEVFAAQNTAPNAAQAEPVQHEKMPAPTNLKVLPHDLTGEQVHEIMHKWAAELGTNCKSCHTVDPKNLGPDGNPRLNYADDSKQEKQTARKMYQMVEDINVNHISKIDSSGEPVACGTCHRGHLAPEPYVPSPQAL